MKKQLFTLFLLLICCGLGRLHGQGDCLILKADHHAASPGATVCVDVSGEQFQDVVGMQFSLKWDDEVLNFQEVTNFGLPNLQNSNFGLPEVTGFGDRLSFFWTAEAGQSVSLPPNETLFSVCFEVENAAGAHSLIEFDTRPTALEFLTGTATDFGFVSATLLSGSVTVSGSLPDFPLVRIEQCPQANGCSEVPPVGIQPGIEGGSPPYTFRWSGPDDYASQEQNIDDLLPGTYQLEVTDEPGRSTTALFYLAEPRPIRITDVQVQQPESCAADATGSIRLSVSGGSGAYAYQWSDSVTTEQRDSLQAGIYELTVTDMLLGCATVESFTIHPNGQPAVAAALITPVSCGTTQSGAIELQLAGGGENVQVEWNTGATGPALEALAAGAYSATITNAMGCTAIWSGTVTTSDAIELSGRSGYTDCSQSTGFIELEVPGDPEAYTYAWTNGATTKDLQGLAFGAYRVTVTHPGSGCTGTRIFYLQAETFSTSSSWECTVVDENTVFAEVSTIVWEGGAPPYHFQWSNGDSATADQIGSTTISLPATITLTITDANGCQTIPAPVSPDCGLTSTGNFSTASSYECLEDEDGKTSRARIDYYVWAGGAPPYTFTWSTGDTTTGTVKSSILVPADAVTAYTVTVTDQLGNSHVSAPIIPLCRIDGNPLTIDIGETSTAAGAPACVPVMVSGFDDIAGLQFSIAWDPSQLIGDSLINVSLPNFSSVNYNLGPFVEHPDEGTLTLSWINSSGQGLQLPDSSTLFELCFTAIGDRDTVDLVLSNHPAVIEATTAALQVIPVIPSNGAVYIEAAGAARVWPGDTDDNGLVDHFDLLNIGLAFGAQGYPRPQASLQWEAQFAAPWSVQTPNTEIDFRHIDTDGNGRIDAVDTLALALNYGLFNEQWAGQDGFAEREQLPASARSSGTPIFVDTYPVQEGGAPVFDIVLGDDAATDQAVYGLAFSVNYDPLAIVPGSIGVSFAQSWLGTEGVDLLTFYRVDPDRHLVHIALTRTDGQDIIGQGPVAQLLVTIEDVIFRSNDYEIPISIENAVLITSREEAVPVEERSSLITVTGTTHTLRPELDRQIGLYPIPAGEEVFLRLPQNLRLEGVELYDLSGRLLQYWPEHRTRLPLTRLPDGPYALRLITGQGATVKRILIAH